MEERLEHRRENEALKIEQLQQMKQQEENNSIRIEKLTLKEQKCLRVGLRHGMNFEDKTEVESMLASEYLNNLFEDLKEKIKIVKESTVAQRKKLSNEITLLRKERKSLKEKRDEKARQLNTLGEELNERIGQCSLMRMQFEFKKKDLELKHKRSVSMDLGRSSFKSKAVNPIFTFAGISSLVRGVGRSIEKSMDVFELDRHKPDNVQITQQIFGEETILEESDDQVKVN